MTFIIFIVFYVITAVIKYELKDMSSNTDLDLFALFFCSKQVK